MDKIDLDDLALNYPGNEDLLQVYKDWGGTDVLRDLLDELDRYDPEWNKEKELGSWASEFILDILQEEDWGDMPSEERKKHFEELLDDRYEDFRCGHQFARVNNITLHIREGENMDALLAETDEKVMFPKLV